MRSGGRGFFGPSGVPRIPTGVYSPTDRSVGNGEGGPKYYTAALIVAPGYYTARPPEAAPPETAPAEFHRWGLHRAPLKAYPQGLHRTRWGFNRPR